MSDLTRRMFLRNLGAGGLALGMTNCAGVGREAASATPPSILVVLVDDMGYSDIGCYGGEIDTPNIDALARNGVRFTQAYNTARCCPSRASLISGLYPHQAGMGWMTAANLGTDGYSGDLNCECVTIAEALKPAGYGTYMSGKWHLTYDKPWYRNKASWPCQRGFDRYYGIIEGAANYFAPVSLVRDNTRIKPPDPDSDYYLTDAISDNACRFVKDHAENRTGTPFFLYVAYTAPHWPLHAKPEDIAKYRGRYMMGWDVLRLERHARMVEMGLVDKAWPLTPRDPNSPPWDELDDERKDDMDLRMAVYAGQIDCMDQGVGRIVAALKHTGQLDNTLILFLSDNGACWEHGPFGFNNTQGREIGGPKSWASYGFSWANASNTPFRLYKSYTHEGGIATPLIAHWPNGMAARGELRHHPCHIVDIMPTCLELAGASYPKKYNGHTITPLEGTCLLPAFNNEPLNRREPIYWEHEGNRAIRDGKWKLVARSVEGPWELYDMEADRTEMHDLSGAHPEIAKALADAWQRYAERAEVFPLDGRGWNERIRESSRRQSRKR